MHRRTTLTCHCEAPKGPWQSRSTRPHRGKAIGENATAFPRLPRRFAPRNDTSGGCGGAPELSSGLMPLCKAVTDRRYRRNWSVRFIDALYELQVPSRDCHVASLLAMTHQGSAVAHQRPPTVELSRTRRSLSAATVKFGSDCVRRHSVYIGGAFPRLHPKGTSSRFALRAPRPRWGLAMTAARRRITAAIFTAAVSAQYAQGAPRKRQKGR